MTKTKPKTYILRWNPAISSFKLEHYRHAVTKYPFGWASNWSVYEYEEARKGDHFYMVRVGEGHTGVVFRGLFMSEPYKDKDWAGTRKKRYYVDIACYDCADPDKPATVPIDKLSEEMPEIDWNHGPSGMLLTDEQARKLDALWKANTGDLYWPEEEEKEEENVGPDGPDAPFDKNQGHGSHFECIDRDINVVVSEAFDLIHRKQNVVGEVQTTMNELDGTTHGARIRLQSTDEHKEITMRSLFEMKPDMKDMITIFPYVVNDKPVALTLRRINEFNNGLEAVLSCSFDDGGPVAFFDADYARHKDEYKIGATYSFALSALAYDAERVPKSELLMDLSPEEVEKMHQDRPELIKKDKRGRTLPMTMKLDALVAFCQESGRYPDNGEFQSPIAARIRTVRFLSYDFYRMEITIHFSLDEEPLTIPLIVRKDFFDEVPRKGTPVRGFIWLQGKMIDKTAN